MSESERLSERSQRRQAAGRDGSSEPSIAGPLTRLGRNRLRWLIWGSGAATLVLGVALYVIDEQIRATGGPGIVGLQVAGSPGGASAILADWGTEGVRWARISLLIDFPFLVAYGLFLAGLATAAGRRLRPIALGPRRIARLGSTLHRLAPWLAWAVLLAAGLDVIENLALLQVVDFNLTPWTQLAQTMATAKFGILGAAVAYLLAAGALILTDRPNQRLTP